MALRSGSIPNFINGVSQQAASLRLASQAQEQINCFPTLIDGLRKRPSLRHKARLMDSAGLPFTHTINRDASERYEVIATNGNLRVFTLEGIERPVNFPNGKGYLSNPNPDTRFRAVTVADYTFFLNKDVTVAMKDDSRAPAKIFGALVNVKQGNYGKRYSITLNGTLVAVYVTPDGSAASQSVNLDAVTIATNLVTDLAAHSVDPGHGYTVTQYSNVIYISATSDFTIATTDGFNGSAMLAIKDKVQHFSDLSTKGPAGFTVEVVGDDTTQFDNYFVSLQADGTWHETVNPGELWEIDRSTMPHVLVREADGSFTFKETDWTKRLVGNAITNEQPSFIGRTLSDVYFHRNRLGLLSDENAILSAAGDFFRFWRKTVVAVLDDDPIDIGATHTKVSLLRHAVPFRDQLLVFSDQTQFSLHTSTSGILTPKTVAITPTTELPCTQYARPVATGDLVFFLADGNFTRVYEYKLDPDTQAFVGEEVTNHVPSYIAGGVPKAAVSSKHNILATVASANLRRLYLYQWYVAGRDKLQSAWHYWDTGEGSSIVGFEFVDSDLYLVVDRDGGLWLEVVNIDPKQPDTSLTYWQCLDRRVHTDNLAAPSYDNVLDRTSYVLPYTVPSAVVAAVAQSTGSFIAGMPLVVDSYSGTTLRLKGNTTAAKLFIGIPYRATYTLSSILPKRPTQTGPVVISDARLQLRYLSLVYGDNTADWQAFVTPYGRDTKTYLIAGYLLGTTSSDIPPLGVSGTQRIPIMSRSDTTTISFISDSHLPGALISADWEGQLFMRAQPSA